ncbi:hypothetical protein E2C01_045098 [Portunus trituberculatus]|uniref:Uncharacterized protein n=1 Tax=Portunus trituberculatus TaxID=210409 RepID=A0A5B7G448_PORTR|nr:hypothetical protein [Portunus trituberculatus]
MNDDIRYKCPLGKSDHIEELTIKYELGKRRTHDNDTLNNSVPQSIADFKTFISVDFVVSPSVSFIFSKAMSPVKAVTVPSICDLSREWYCVFQVGICGTVESMACLVFPKQSAVIMSSSYSGEEWATVPSGYTFAPRRACGSAQDLSGGGSDSGRSTVFAGECQHLFRHGSCLWIVDINASCPQPAATQVSVPSAQWNIVLDNVAELRSEINQLKVDREASSPPS